MTPEHLADLVGAGEVRLTFTDGEVIRARIIHVDPHVADNHVFYDVLALEATGRAPNHHVVGRASATSAGDIVSALPIDGTAA